MEPRVSMITCGTSDLERSIRFYRDGLRLPLREPSEEGVSFFTMAHVWLGLFPREDLARDAGATNTGASLAFPGFSMA